MTQLQPAQIAWHGAFEPETIAAIPTEAEHMKHRPFEAALERFHERIKDTRAASLEESERWSQL